MNNDNRGHSNKSIFEPFTISAYSRRSSDIRKAEDCSNRILNSLSDRHSSSNDSYYSKVLSDIYPHERGDG